MTAIAILDYGMGNLRSVEKALQRVEVEVTRTSDPERAGDAEGLVLPGVGAFPRAMERVRERGFDVLVADAAARGTPVLGICLGMQLLFSSTSENEGAEGLDLLEGPVERLAAPQLKVPHIGWNEVRVTQPHPLLESIGAGDEFYFVHSYRAMPGEAKDVAGRTDYGGEFPAAVARDNVFAVQFHPEKSQAAGKQLLDAFAAWMASR